MTVVRGYLQLLQFKEEFASQRKRFDTMIGEIDRASAIITEFLSLSRNEPTELTRQSINSIVTTLVPLIQADAANNQVAVSVDLAEVPDLNMDERQIRQLVLNLVRNGIEAMSRQGELTIKTSRKKDWVVLSIKDQGNGIPPEVLEKLGTPFFTTKEKGTGLGLPVCYRIAERHNARVEIKTGKRGTTFMVSFPILSPQGCGELI
jgi:signal transduction histidine kinase